MRQRSWDNWKSQRVQGCHSDRDGFQFQGITDWWKPSVSLKELNRKPWPARDWEMPLALFQDPEELHPRNRSFLEINRHSQTATRLGIISTFKDYPEFLVSISASMSPDTSRNELRSSCHLILFPQTFISTWKCIEKKMRILILCNFRNASFK